MCAGVDWRLGAAGENSVYMYSMATYTFKTSSIPLVTITDAQGGNVAYELSHQRLAFARRGGVMESVIASELKPWAKPVRLDFTGYRIGSREWVDLEVGHGLWGCLLNGPEPGQYVAFVVLEQGVPVPTKVDPRWIPRK